MRAVFSLRGRLSTALCACLLLSAPVFAGESPPGAGMMMRPPPPPEAGDGARPMMPPPDWPSEFRRPRNPEDMRRWRERERGEGPPGHPPRNFSEDERKLLRRDLDRARREIYRDWRAWPLPPPALPSERRRPPPMEVPSDTPPDRAPNGAPSGP